jgi:hypothetical protein
MPAVPRRCPALREARERWAKGIGHLAAENAGKRFTYVGDASAGKCTAGEDAQIKVVTGAFGRLALVINRPVAGRHGTRPGSGGTAGAALQQQSWPKI